MKTVFKPRFLTILLALVLVPIPLMPQAAAQGPYAWSLLSEFEIINSAGAHDVTPYNGGTVAMGASTTWSAYEASPTTTEQGAVQKCTETVCSGGAFFGTADTTRNGVKVSVLSDTVVYGCTTASTAGLTFFKTSNGGALWSQVSVGTAAANSCDVSTWDGSHYVIVWANQTTTDYIASISVDSGNTWEHRLVLAVSSVPDARGIAVMAWSDTDYSAFLNDGANFAECKSSDTGVTWTCGAFSNAAGNTINKEFLNGSYYFSFAGDSTDLVTFGIKTGLNDALATATAYGVSDASFSYCSADVAVFDSSRVGIAFQKCTTGAAATNTGWFTESLDGGATWSEPELVFTSEADVGATFGTAGSAYLGNGRIINTFQTIHSDGAVCDAADGDAAAERCFYAYISAGSAPIAASASASVTNLVGFDLDPTGTRAVARTYGGDCVEIWAAKTLGNNAQCPVAQSVETNCDLGFYEDAVAAMYGGALVMFLNCDVAGSPEFMSIRDPGGDVPTASEFSDCTPGSASGECPYDITITEAGWGQFDDLGQLGQIKDFPVDYSNRDDDVGFVARLAWGFSSQDPDPGHVGVASFVRAEPASPDIAEEAQVAYSATVAEDFCVGLDGEQYYVAAADTSENVKTWPVSFTTSIATPNIGGAVVFGVSGAAGISCGGGQVAFIAGTTLYYATRAGLILDTYNLADISARGVAISEEYTIAGATCDDAVTDASCKQAILAYKDDTDVILVFTTNLGELVLQGELEVTVDGGLKGLEIDHHANGAWLAQTGRVDYYDIANLTNNGTLVPSECVFNCEGDGFDGVDEDGLFAGSGATIGTAFGVGAFGGNLFLGAVLMGIVAYGVGIGYGNAIDGNTMQPRALRVNPWAAAVGAAVGFLMAWGFGFFSTAVVFSLIALVAMIVGIRLWVSRG